MENRVDTETQQEKVVIQSWLLMLCAPSQLHSRNKEVRKENLHMLRHRRFGGYWRNEGWASGSNLISQSILVTVYEGI